MKQVTLNLGGKDRVCHFGLGFLGNILDKTETNMIDFDRLRTENPFKWLPLLVYYSLEYNCIKNKEEIDFDLVDVTEWLDNSDLDTFKKFNEAFTQSLIKDVPQEKEVKKKVTKK